jgi:hypothetical protein
VLSLIKNDHQGKERWQLGSGGGSSSSSSDSGRAAAEMLQHGGSAAEARRQQVARQRGSGTATAGSVAAVSAVQGRWRQLGGGGGNSGIAQCYVFTYIGT